MSLIAGAVACADASLAAGSPDGSEAAEIAAPSGLDVKSPTAATAEALSIVAAEIAPFTVDPLGLAAVGWLPAVGLGPRGKAGTIARLSFAAIALDDGPMTCVAPSLWPGGE